jgi:hypothetical protein
LVDNGGCGSLGCSYDPASPGVRTCVCGLNAVHVPGSETTCECLPGFRDNAGVCEGIFYFYSKESGEIILFLPEGYWHSIFDHPERNLSNFF